MKHDDFIKYSGCDVPVCDRTYYARGYCKAHYYQAERSGGYVPNLPVLAPPAYGADRRCTHADCITKHHSRGLCHTHYTRLLRSEKRSYRESRKNLLTSVTLPL